MSITLRIARNQSTSQRMILSKHDPAAGCLFCVGHCMGLRVRLYNRKTSGTVRERRLRDLCSSLEGRGGSRPLCVLYALTRSVKFILGSCRGEVCISEAPFLTIFRISSCLLFFVCCIDLMTCERTCNCTCTERCTHSHSKCSLMRVCYACSCSCVVKHTLLHTSNRSATAAQDLLN